MSDTNIRQFRLLSGETVIASFVGVSENKPEFDVYEDAIQLVVTDSLQNPQEQSVGFAPFPEYNNPSTTTKLEFNRNNIVFFIDPDTQFVEQYKKIFSRILAPSSKIIVGK